MRQSLLLWVMRTQVPGCFPSFNRNLILNRFQKVTRYQIARNHYQNQQSAVEFPLRARARHLPKKKVRIGSKDQTVPQTTSTRGLLSGSRRRRPMRIGDRNGGLISDFEVARRMVLAKIEMHWR